MVFCDCRCLKAGFGAVAVRVVHVMRLVSVWDMRRVET